jgi:hypothetical protein
MVNAWVDEVRSSLYNKGYNYFKLKVITSRSEEISQQAYRKQVIRKTD